MKKRLVVTFLALFWTIANAQDTVYLKTKQVLTGKFKSIQCLNIKFISYKKEVIIPLKKVEKVISKGQEINLTVPCPEVSSNSENKAPETDTTKGTALFECYMCAEKGKLEFVSKNNNTKTTSNFSFLTNETPYLYRHRETLLPGEYNWFYSDKYNMKTKGTINIVANKEVKIVLFENKEN